MVEPLLHVEDLKVHFPIKKGLFSKVAGYVYAVDGVSFTLDKGEILGIVGESGCGKTTTGLALLQLTDMAGGTVKFEGRNLAEMTPEEMNAFRQKMQIVFQDPYSSLNPRMTLHKTLAEPMKIHGVSASQKEREERIDYLLESVGLQPEQKSRYPHQFSGGQRQRIGIARALCLNPQIIIGDEPVSALDVSIQAQIINLLLDLQQEFELSYIIITHDLSVVEHLCDRILVMYLGKVVEAASYRDLYSAPKHPYTQALLSAVPKPDPGAQRERIILQGDVPSPIHPPAGCHFHPRCPHRMEICSQTAPELKHLGDDHFSACHLL